MPNTWSHWDDWVAEETKQKEYYIALAQAKTEDLVGSFNKSLSNVIQLWRWEKKNGPEPGEKGTWTCN